MLQFCNIFSQFDFSMHIGGGEQAHPELLPIEFITPKHHCLLQVKKAFGESSILSALGYFR